jgi:cobyrinic acid a,c-diamide synthase
MVLGKSLEDADGKTHEMLGLLGHATSFAYDGFDRLAEVGLAVAVFGSARTLPTKAEDQSSKPRDRAVMFIA